MSTGNRIGSGVGTRRVVAAAVIGLLLFVVSAQAVPTPPSEFVGPIDLKSWIRGPVYVMHLDGGSRHGLTPEIFEDYLAAASDLDEHDLLVVILEGHQVGPRFLIETVDFAQALQAHTRVVALAGDVYDGTAALFLAFDERYLLDGASLNRLMENEFSRVWQISQGYVLYGPGDGPPSEEPLVDREGGLVELVLAFALRRWGLSYERDEKGAVTWRRDVGGTHVVESYGEGFSIGEALAVDTGIAQGVVADERALAVALTEDQQVRLVYLGEDIPRHWAGCFGSADRLVRPVLDEIHELLRQAEDGGEPVGEAVLDELEQKLPLLHYWERELGSMAWRYGLPEGANTPDYYESQVRLMRQSGRPPSAFTREDLEVLRVEVWPESESSETE